MERTDVKDLNKIIIQGPIVRVFANEIATNFTIKTPRLNMPNVANFMTRRLSDSQLLRQKRN